MKDEVERIKRVNKAFELYYIINRKGRWNTKEGRVELLKILEEDPEDYINLSSQGFIFKIVKLLENEAKKANEYLYFNLYELVRNYKPEEIGELFFFIPFTPTERINKIIEKDENLKRISQHHKAITEIRETSFEKYRNRILKEKKAENFTPAELTDEYLEIEINMEVELHKNYIIGNLKRIK